MSHRQKRGEDTNKLSDVTFWKPLQLNSCTEWGELLDNRSALPLFFCPTGQPAMDIVCQLIVMHSY